MNHPDIQNSNKILHCIYLAKVDSRVVSQVSLFVFLFPDNLNGIYGQILGYGVAIRVLGHQLLWSLLRSIYDGVLIYLRQVGLECRLPAVSMDRPSI